jgi:hypothetical protein
MALPANGRVRRLVEAVDQSSVRRHVEALAAFPTRHVASGERGIGAAARYIEAELRRCGGVGVGRLRVSRDAFEAEVPRLGGRRLAMANVVAELPGEKSPERVIVVGGHYDSRASDPADAESRAPGADDDASGTAVVLELARVLAGESFPGTLVFIAFTGEEVGLFGSRHWATAARAAGRDVVAMLNNDMVGNARDARGGVVTDRVRVLSEGLPRMSDAEAVRRFGAESDSPSRQLARYVWELAPRYVPGLAVDLVFRPDRLGRGGDHLPFNEQGFPAVRFCEALEHYDRHHQDVREEDGRRFGDLPENVDFAYTTRIARLNCAAMASLALAPAPPAEAWIEGAVSPRPRIVWLAVDGAGVTYAVRLRSTTAPVWEERIEVGGATSFDLPVAASDVHAAVQSVGPGGIESPAVLALPRLPRPPWG